MRLILSLFLLSFLSGSVQAFEYPYKRLSKLYGKQSANTLISAKRLMKWFPDNPAPYYFASLVHFEQVENWKSSRKQYRELSKSLDYASKLQDLGNEEFELKVEWDTLSSAMLSKSLWVKEQMAEDEMDRLIAILDKKIQGLHWNEATEVSFDPVGVVDFSGANTTFSGQKFFGLPNGSELIPSHDTASEQEMLRLINAERVKLGMDPFVWEEKLANAARYHAYDMGSQNYFDHATFDRNNGRLKRSGRTFDRIRKFYNETFVNSENIAAGNETAKATYNQWYTSKGHYENMFNSNSKRIGIGVCKVPGSTYEYYWVMCTAL
jgi:uncharacterized protein YkwD